MNELNNKYKSQKKMG